MLQNKLTHAYSPNAISLSTAVAPTTDALFLCFFCGNVPFQGVYDESCEQFFCKPCVFQRHKPYLCPVPNCQQTFRPRETTKVAARVFNAMLFKCAVCSQTYFYASHGQHVAECRAALAARCVLGCGCSSLSQFKETHLFHLYNDCPRAKLVCNACKTVVSKGEASSHKCDQSFVKWPPTYKSAAKAVRERESDEEEMPQERPDNSSILRSDTEPSPLKAKGKEESKS
jgi:hypothetical protein